MGNRPDGSDEGSAGLVFEAARVRDALQIDAKTGLSILRVGSGVGFSTLSRLTLVSSGTLSFDVSLLIRWND